ncbi:MAG: methionine synthase [Chloroflexi bacterium]|nr:methionine synthase [Chloroflexota bacterium]
MDYKKMSFLDLLKNNILLSDGATGTFLQSKGLEPGGCPELMNVEKEEAVIEMADRYFKSGSDFVLTNTFGGSPFMLKKYGYEDKVEEFNKKGAMIAKSVCPDGKFVFGSIGPTGEFIEPLGAVTEKEMSYGFERQINGLLEGGVDGIIFETQMAIEELVLGIKTAKKITNLPIIGSMVFDKGPRGFFTMMGVSPKKAADDIYNAGGDVIATNCGNGSEIMVDLANELKQSSKLPVMVQSNAGIPKIKNKKVIYDETPEFMIKNYQKFIDIGISIVGGCCGTTFDHIEAFRNLINENK